MPCYRSCWMKLFLRSDKQHRPVRLLSRWLMATISSRSRVCTRVQHLSPEVTETSTPASIPPRTDPQTTSTYTPRPSPPAVRCCCRLILECLGIRSGRRLVSCHPLRTFRSRLIGPRCTPQLPTLLSSSSIHIHVQHARLRSESPRGVRSPTAHRRGVHCPCDIWDWRRRAARNGLDQGSGWSESQCG